MSESSRAGLPDDDQEEIDCVTEIHSTSITRDRRHILLCTNRGLAVFSTTSFRCVCYIETPGFSVIDADIVPDTSLVGIVTGTRTFEIWNASTRRRIFPSVKIDGEIKALRLNAKRVLVLTASHLVVLNLRNLELLYAFPRGDDVPVVTQPLISLRDNGLCAFTTSDGGVQLIDSFTLVRFQEIKTHTSPVSAIELTDSLLITASTKGTIVRVFQVPTMKLVGLFRRGRNATPIRSLLVSASLEEGSVLAVTGDSDTAHLFKVPAVSGSDNLPPDVDTSPKQAPSVLASVLSLFPRQYKDAIEAVRDFSFIRLRRESSFRYIAAVKESGKRGFADVIVVSEESGFAFVYETNLNKGGECRLKSEHALLSDIGELDVEPSRVDSVGLEHFASFVGPSGVNTIAIDSIDEMEKSRSSDNDEKATHVPLETSETVTGLTPQESPAAVSTEDTMEDVSPTESKKRKKKKKKKGSDIASEDFYV